MRLMDLLLPRLEHLPSLGYVAVFLFSFIESLAFVGLLVPGTIIVILIGAFAARSPVLDIVDLIWFAAAGAILGDALSFHLGRRGTRAFQPGSRWFRPHHLERGERFFSRYGAASIVFGRFIGPIRAVVPFIAGLGQMSAFRFYALNIVSGIAWAIAYLLLGYFFGHSWQAIEAFSSRAGFVILAVVAFAVVLYYVRRALLRHGPDWVRLVRSVARSGRRAIDDDPEVRALVARHAGFFRAVAARLDRTHFMGLPLTLLALAFVYVSVWIIGLSTDVATGDRLVGVDRRIAALVAFNRTSALTEVFVWATIAGKALVVAVGAVIVSVGLWISGKRTYLAPLWITLAGATATTTAAKLAFHRTRPDLAMFLEDSFSFPSGHATAAMAFYGFVAYLLAREARSWTRRINIAAAGVAVIAAIALSRAYLTVHFASDVLGGLTVGLLWLIIGVAVHEWRRSRTVGVPPIRHVSVALVAALSTVMFLGFYVAVVVSSSPEPKIVASPVVHVTATAGLAEAFVLDKLPAYTETLTGDTLQALDFLIISPGDVEVAAAFMRAGWQVGDQPTLRNAAVRFRDGLLRAPHRAVPPVIWFWNERPHHLAFSQTTMEGTALNVRVWRTGIRVEGGRSVYAATSSLQTSGGLFHRDRVFVAFDAADAVLSSLYASGKVFSVTKIRLDAAAPVPASKPLPSPEVDVVTLQ